MMGAIPIPATNRRRAGILSYLDKERQALASKKYYEANKTAVKARSKRRNKEILDLIKTFIEWLKQQPCMDCGVEWPPYAMDFDHRDPCEKRDSVSKLMNDNASPASILTEILKCDLVCCSCHRIRTHS